MIFIYFIVSLFSFPHKIDLLSNLSEKLRAWLKFDWHKGVCLSEIQLEV